VKVDVAPTFWKHAASPANIGLRHSVLFRKLDARWYTASM